MFHQLYNLKVTDRQTFVQFLELLREDLKLNPKEWENDKLDDFLEALARYAEDMQGYYDNAGQEKDADNPDWQTFADLFKGAKVYE